MPKPKAMTVEEHNEKLQMGAFNTPVQKRARSGKPSTRNQTQNDRVKGLKLRRGVGSGSVCIVEKATLDEYDIKYVLEAIAQIIAAKVKSGSINLWTPYGDCTLRKMTTDNFWVIVKDKGCMAKRQSTTYKTLLTSLKHCENSDIIKKNIVNFLCAEANGEFSIDTSATNLEDQINSCLRKYHTGILTPNNIAATICGIFVSEMIRSCGKVVRAAFRPDWPQTYEELKSRFLLANKRGAKLFRDYLQDPKSVSEEISKAQDANVSRFSPAGCRKKRRLTEPDA